MQDFKRSDERRALADRVSNAKASIAALTTQAQQERATLEAMANVRPTARNR